MARAKTAAEKATAKAAKDKKDKATADAKDKAFGTAGKPAGKTVTPSHGRVTREESQKTKHGTRIGRGLPAEPDTEPTDEEGAE